MQHAGWQSSVHQVSAARTWPVGWRMWVKKDLAQLWQCRATIFWLNSSTSFHLLRFKDLQSNGRWCDNAPAYGEKTGIGCFAMRVTNKLWKAWRAFMLACSKQKLLLATLLSMVFCHHTSPQMYQDMVMVLSRGYTYHLLTCGILRLHSTISSVRKSRSQVGTITGCHRGFQHAVSPTFSSFGVFRMLLGLRRRASIMPRQNQQRWI